MRRIGAGAVNGDFQALVQSESCLWSSGRLAKPLAVVVKDDGGNNDAAGDEALDIQSEFIIVGAPDGRWDYCGNLANRDSIMRKCKA